MRIRLILIFALLVSPLTFGQTIKDEAAKGSEAELELRALANKWNEAEVKGDAVTIDSLLATEFSFLGGSNRTSYLALMKPDPSLVIELSVIEDQEVQIYGETAILTGLNFYKFKKNGQPYEGKFLSLTIWVKKGGRWQCVKASTQAVDKNLPTRHLTNTRTGAGSRGLFKTD